VSSSISSDFFRTRALEATSASSVSIKTSATISYGQSSNLSAGWYGFDFYSVGPDPGSGATPSGVAPFLYYNLSSFLQGTGKVNAIRFHIYAHTNSSVGGGDWGYFGASWGSSFNFQSAVQQSVKSAQAVGIKVIISCFQDYPMPSTEGGDDANKVPMTEIIQNVSGYETNWINDYTKIISACQPDGVEIMNEPIGTATFAQYRAFVVESATAFHKVDPNAVFFVMGYPYWQGPSDWVSQPLTGFGTVYYTAHIYYNAGASTGTTYGQDYESGNLAQAKSDLDNYILSTLGIQSMINSGLPVCWTEAGYSNGDNLNNWQQFLKDLYSFVISNSEGFMQFALEPSPPYSWGCLNSTWNGLNAQGQIWQEYGPS
jgi:hypothetical protein